MEMNVGFVGLGNMGLPIVRRLLDAGHAGPKVYGSVPKK